MKSSTFAAIVVAFLATLCLLFVFIGTGQPLWAIIVLGVFALIEAIALLARFADQRHARR
jgi:Flp pilus assembly protein TadB